MALFSSDPALNAYTRNLSPEQLAQARSRIFNGYSDGGLNFGAFGGTEGSVVQQGEDAVGSTGLPLGGYVGYNQSQVNNDVGGYFQNIYDPTGKFLKQSYVAPPNGFEKAIDMGSMAVLAAAGGYAAGGATGLIGAPAEAGAGAGAGGVGDAGGAAAFNPAADSQLANAAMGPEAYAGYGAQGAAGAAFNPAVDSQLANTAINSTGGNALSGYATAGVPSVAGGAGGAGSSVLGNLGSGVSNLLSGGGGTTGLLGAGLNLAGGLVGANAAKNAANTQAQSAANAQALEKQMFDKQVELQQPWHDTGVSGLNMLSQYLGLKTNDGSAGTSYGSLLKPFGMADYQADPGYGFRMQQGTQALDRSAAARGGLLSGRAAKDTLNYSQGLASQEYGNAYNRYNTDQANQYNRLASTAGLGQTAANTIGNAAQSYGNNAANLITSGGAAQAAGQVGSANALTNGMASAWNAYQNNQLLNRLLPGYGS